MYRSVWSIAGRLIQKGLQFETSRVQLKTMGMGTLNLSLWRLNPKPWKAVPLIWQRIAWHTEVFFFFFCLASLHGPLLLHVSSNTHTTMLMFLSVVIDLTVEKNSVFYCDKHPLGNFLFLHSRKRGRVPGASTDPLARPFLPQIFRNACSSAVRRKHCLPGELTWSTAAHLPASC